MFQFTEQIPFLFMTTATADLQTTSNLLFLISALEMCSLGNQVISTVIYTKMIQPLTDSILRSNNGSINQ